MSTIKDVAKYAGVSTATVSRVLNKKGPLSEKTIQKVNEAVEKLAYHPNVLARSLASGKNNTVGVLVPSYDHPFWSELLQKMEEEAKRKGYNVLFTCLLGTLEEKQKALEYLVSRQVNGIIVCAYPDSDFWKEAKKKFNLPVAFMVSISECAPSIISDDKQGGLLAARHLIAKGCKKLVHISGNLSYYKEADDRTYAFVEEAKRRNVDCYVYQNTIDITKLEELQKFVNKVFYEQPDMDGMFLSNDILAAQCIAFALSQGLRIPDDLRIIGYDDIYISSLIYPSLTTIRQNYSVLAETALENVLAQINGEKVEEVTVIPVELIERKTT